MKPKETILALLQRRKLRLTATRETLIEWLLEASRPLSYDDAKTRLRMDKATFYRNMHTFEAAGVIRRIASDEKKWYFELATSPHAHFVCTVCHRILCLDTLPITVPEGCSVDTVIYKGRCPACNA